MKYSKTGKISLKPIFKKWRTLITETDYTWLSSCPDGDKGVRASLNIPSCLWNSILFVCLFGWESDLANSHLVLIPKADHLSLLKQDKG